MKRYLFISIAVFGLICSLSFSLHAQPCTTVTKISSFQYSAFIVGDPNTLTLRAEHGSIYLNGTFTVTSGMLPTGLTLVGNKITGTPTTPGIFVFTIGAASGPGCPIFERVFAFNVTWNLPCTDFTISVPSHSSPPQQLNRTGSIIFRTEHFDSVTYTPVSLPPGFSLNHTPGSYQAIVSGSTQYDGPHTVTVAASTNKGCIDTLSYTWYVYCSIFAVDSIRPSKPKLPYAIIGEIYNQGFSARFGPSPSPLIALTDGALPPGLTFSNSRITGIPTTPGIYTFKLSAIASPDGCTLLEQWYNLEVVAPNTVCIHYDAIAPSPAEIDSLTYYANEAMSITLSASKDGIVDDSAFFKITSDFLPEGITINGNVISGTTERPGTRRFTVGAFSKEGCPYYEQEYTLSFVLQHPCDDFHVARLWGEQGFTMVGVTMFEYIGYSGDFDSVTIGVVHLPPGISSEQLSPSELYISGHPLQVGYDEFVYAGATAEGCQDTLVVGANFTCLFPQPILPEPKDLTFLPINEEYFTYIGFESPYMIDVNYDNFRMEITEGALPPGLVLSDTTWVSGYIHGTPTTAGTYTFTVTAMIETCAITKQTYTLVIREREPIQSLTLHSICSNDPLHKRWRIHNPNDFNIPVTWQPLYFYNGPPIPIVAQANSDTYFYSFVVNVPEPSFPGTIKLSWTDGDGTPRSIVKAASTELCDPPACAFASDIVSFHQGMQKNWYNVDDNYSAPYWALDEPDANDLDVVNIHHYALGYSGFIVLRMSSVINDAPGNDLIVYEHSPGNPTFAENPERAEVQISQDGVNWVSLGLTSPATCQGILDHAFDISGKLPWFRFVKVIDKTDRNARILNTACAPTTVFAFNGLSDGFDLDAVTCGEGATFARMETVAEETDGSKSVSPIYPNPVKDWLAIDLSAENIGSDKQAEINIRDLSGKTLYQKIHTLQSATVRIEVSDYRTGMYILQVRSSIGKSGFYKFIKD